MLVQEVQAGSSLWEAMEEETHQAAEIKEGTRFLRCGFL